ncbi:MAG TPA: cupin domain-containing protein [Rhizobiales bacterium]|nr:cupin domain-containing protein [Hyphomicrobiales bacterium]
MNIAASPVRAPRRAVWMGTDYSITMGTYESGGLIGVFVSTVPARGGPPVHVHHNEDEVIHVLEGSYEFWLDGEIIPVPAGQSIFLPRGVPHTFRVAGDTPGRNLTILTPGGMEDFFVEAAARDLRIPDHMADVVELGGRYGLEFRGPADWSAASAAR